MYVGMYRRGVSAAERFKRETSAYLFRLLCKEGFSVESKYCQLGLTLKIGMRKYLYNTSSDDTQNIGRYVGLSFL